MDIKEEHNEFFHELDGHGFIFQNKNWLGGCFEDDQLQVVWEMWQAAKAQVVPEGFVLVPKEPTEQILNRMTNAPIEVNHLCDNADIFLSEDEARIAYKAMIEAQEPTND